ncbi:hypothetical protein P389DRAFT_41940 [Cystobasidium minutum MCA 4210]|uniref:uncharacterized protein n=1 Tax=Cystobasidium minutum MCA 4210 TaxID=1397322 RepID=UPI0034CFBCFC|eukprot:jgi/Rhomi1/41940/CE41939_3925
MASSEAAGGSELPGNLPGAAAVFAALDTSLKHLPNLDPLLRKAMREYVKSLCLPATSPPTSTIPFDEQSHYDRLERRVRRILSDNQEPADYVKRFKRPTGSMSARAGNLLFYPPSTNKDTNRDTLVYGPDTTSRMLRAGLTGTGLYTMDMYPFSTKVPQISAENKAFKWDKSFGDSDTAVDLWDLFNPDACSIYARRATKPGLEVVWGAPVNQSYTKATSKLLSSYVWMVSTASLSMPGISNEHGTFEAGDFTFDYQIAYRKILDRYEFGKVVIKHRHPCRPGAVRAKGGSMTESLWRDALFSDALLQVLYLVSRGSLPAPPPYTYTFADVARPIPKGSGGVVEFSKGPFLQIWRGKEKVSGQQWNRADLDERDPQIMDIVDRFYTIDYSSSKSILAQVCSTMRARGMATLGVEVVKQFVPSRSIQWGPKVLKLLVPRR